MDACWAWCEAQGKAFPERTSARWGRLCRRRSVAVDRTKILTFRRALISKLFPTTYFTHERDRSLLRAIMTRSCCKRDQTTVQTTEATTHVIQCNNRWRLSLPMKTVGRREGDRTENEPRNHRLGKSVGGISIFCSTPEDEYQQSSNARFTTGWLCLWCNIRHDISHSEEVLR